MDNYDIHDAVEVIDYSGSDRLYNKFVGRKGVITTYIDIDKGYYRVKFPNCESECFLASELRKTNINLLDRIWATITYYFGGW